MSVSLYLQDKPLEDIEIYKLAEATDMIYRRMRNREYARRHVEAVITDEHSAMESAAAKIIKVTPVGTHPVKVINSRNLAVIRVITMSERRAICLGSEGRLYSAFRGRFQDDGKFVPTAQNLTKSFMLVEAKKANRILKRVAILRPSQSYVS